MTANPADAVREALPEPVREAIEKLEDFGRLTVRDRKYRDGDRFVEHYLAPIHDHIAALTARVAEQDAELARLCEIAGYGGVSADAPPRLILASSMFDGLKCCDKWCDVYRVGDDDQPMPESATAYVRADLAEAHARDAALIDWLDRNHYDIGYSVNGEPYRLKVRGFGGLRAALTEAMQEPKP